VQHQWQILDAAASCVLGIEFAPTTTSLINGNVVLTDNTLNTSSASQTISVQGDGSASPATITSPANGSTLTAVSTTFTWSPKWLECAGVPARWYDGG